MSFLDDIINVGKSAIGWLGSGGIGANIAKTAITGFALSQVTKSITKENEKPTANAGTRQQLNPDTQTAIPVVYGQAVIGGKIIDAQITNNNGTRYYCLVLCERTGTLLSNSQQSVITLEKVYYENCAVTFDVDGVTVASIADEDGVIDSTMAGKVAIYYFNNGSTNQASVTGFTITSPTNAYSLMPTWTSNHTMDELVFAIVRVDYDSEAGVTGLPALEFKLSNTLTAPGDVLYDYATNSRYGAGISSAEINA
jgi:hypothetical protein